MSWILEFVVRVAWPCATAAVSLVVFVRSAWSGQPPARIEAPVTGATGRIMRVLDQYVAEDRSGPGRAVGLVAVGHSADGRIQIVRGRLGPGVFREPSPHRVSRAPGDGLRWEACFRICRRDRRGVDVIGCLRTVVKGNNHPDPRHQPDGLLRFEWRLDPRTQAFVLDADPDSFLPAPRELAPDRSWSGLKFFVPLPLSLHTPAVVKRAIRARGGDISGTSESADVLVLPGRADFCTFDRASRPAAVIPALRRGVPVIWERTIEGHAPLRATR